MRGKEKSYLMWKEESHEFAKVVLQKWPFSMISVILLPPALQTFWAQRVLKTYTHPFSLHLGWEGFGCFAVCLFLLAAPGSPLLLSLRLPPSCCSSPLRMEKSPLPTGSCTEYLLRGMCSCLLSPLPLREHRLLLRKLALRSVSTAAGQCPDFTR